MNGKNSTRMSRTATMFKKFSRWVHHAASNLAAHPVEFQPQTLKAGGRTIIFQRAGSADAGAMVEIERRVYHGYAPWNELAFVGELTRQHRLYLVATDDNYIVGFAGCSFDWVHSEAHITNIAVTPGYQGQGIGSALLRTFQAVAVDNGMLTMSLEVRKENTHARRLYRQLGFSAIRVKKGYYEDNHGDAVEMAAPLGKEEKDG